ncbi:cupredoxin domain-containing protein [Phenylobacterium sp.]|uniref:cupredoxin domain-containing protein n=1 Tax=Phenylobacterium sp. TaxID=1871053 RepID=UPI0025D2C984|nr:cupredoxin domain-containing protein [Phenylobacterium sp.]
MRIALAALAVAGLAAAAQAATGPHVVTFTLKDHRFTPAAVEVPAGQRIRIDLINRDAATEEFDSEDLHVEKDVTPNGKVSFEVGPLKPGAYSFMGELHADTANGTITAIAAP